MYQKDLENYLKTRVPRAVLLYGEWEFYIEHYAQKIAKLYPQAQINRAYFGEFQLNECLEWLGLSSLFAQGNLAWLKLDKKLGAKEIQKLLDTLAKHPQNALIVEFYRGAKSQSEYAQDFRQFGANFKHAGLKDSVLEVRFFTPPDGTLLELAQEKIHALHLKISQEALHLLLEGHNFDLRLVHRDLEKLALLGQDIGLKEVQDFVQGMGAVEISSFLNALFAKEGVLELWGCLESEGLDESEWLRALWRYFYQLFGFFAHSQKGQAQAKDILGYNPPPAIVKELKDRCFQVTDYATLFSLLQSWHNANLQGQREKSWHFLIKIQDCIR
ncbi:DNA polymerase III subunit delta [Helicobacter ailurogastricus]|uniref:DNA polymerase III subunit delta n=1 Tax=Helicobacter ailurogastricus TaxID=1578720 RepID=UPI0022CC812D|nr:DNA polymerase III [Helicobacter ailurogastricus]GLH57904.1 DNA polymerase III subunit delta HolA [Helicobacter ailurogastricus]GLH59339.1 DNA polymerase III subunit delta HolA [Helicobacter ailurogastricus]